MERRVKERLIGAAVLMAFAIILIPEMLSGPRRDAKPAVTTNASTDAPFKTYTFDLNRPPGAQPSAELDQRAPDRSPPDRSPSAAGAGARELPPEEVVAEPTREAVLPSSVPTASPTRQAIPETSSPDPALDRQPPDRSPPDRSPSAAGAGARELPSAVSARAPERPATKPDASVTKPTAPIATAPGVPTSRGWAVQLGSFASRATADRLVKDLSQAGQSAFVMPVKSGNSTLYRVRIGPFAERAAANEALREVKSRVANAAVVAHP